MAATVGCSAVALSRTPPPVSGEVPVDALSPARLLLGFDLPPVPTIPGCCGARRASTDSGSRSAA